MQRALPGTAKVHLKNLPARWSFCNCFSCVAYEWFTKKTEQDNCKTYRMNDLKQKKLVSVEINGIIQHPDYIIEVLGAREKTLGESFCLSFQTILFWNIYFLFFIEWSSQKSFILQQNISCCWSKNHRSFLFRTTRVLSWLHKVGGQLHWHWAGDQGFKRGSSQDLPKC